MADSSRIHRRKREGLVDGSSKKVDSVPIKPPMVHPHMRCPLFPETTKRTNRCAGYRKTLNFSSTTTTTARCKKSTLQSSTHGTSHQSTQSTEMSDFETGDSMKGIRSQTQEERNQSARGPIRRAHKYPYGAMLSLDRMRRTRQEIIPTMSEDFQYLQIPFQRDHRCFPPIFLENTFLHCVPIAGLHKSYPVP